MISKTPLEIALELDLQQCRKFAVELMTEKNLVARQLEILANRFKLSTDQKARLRQDASN